MVNPLSNFKRMMHTLTHATHHAAPNPALKLAKRFTGDYGFLDEQTSKSHSLSISPQLDIRIDGQSLPGTVTGITTEKLTFLDHYGYQLIVVCGTNGPESVYDEAEDATYRILRPEMDADA